MKVILDSCFIMACLENHIDWNEIKTFGKIFIPNEVLEEIQFISKDKRQKGKNKEIAKLAINVISSMKKDIEFFNLNQEVDYGLYLFAKNFKESNKKVVTIATTDKVLIKRLKPFAKIITVKGRDKIDFV
jgi:rRNA-processing protein FCF1